MLTHFTEGHLGPGMGRDSSMSPSALVAQPEVGRGGGLKPACLGHPGPLCQVSGAPPTPRGMVSSPLPPHPGQSLSHPGWLPLLKIAQGQDLFHPCCSSPRKWTGWEKNQHSPGPKIDHHPDSAVWGLPVERPGGGVPVPAPPLTHRTKPCLYPVDGGEVLGCAMPRSPPSVCSASQFPCKMWLKKKKGFFQDKKDGNHGESNCIVLQNWKLMA